MSTFLLLLSISFAVIVTTGLLINFCRRRAAATSHGLTGMCHKSGGSMCSCCGSKLVNAANRPPRGHSKGNC